jgi:hypothetical protein
VRRAGEELERIGRVVDEVGSLQAAATRIGQGVTVEELGSIMSSLREVEAEFVPILRDTLVRRYGFAPEEVDGILNRALAAGDARAAGATGDEFRTLVRALADQDENGRPRLCRAMKSAGCGTSGCPCPAICE